eukprot:7545018-Prorocentrum_lima.AAC.1
MPGDLTTGYGTLRRSIPLLHNDMGIDIPGHRVCLCSPPVPFSISTKRGLAPGVYPSFAFACGIA